MSKQFAMLNAARKLESYVSREHYNVEKMKTNSRVPTSLYETKAGQFNDLVNTLNGLFGSLIDGADGLFDEYHIDLVNSEDDYGSYDETDYSVVEPVIVASEPEVITITQTVVAPEREQADWEKDGFSSYSAWIASKDGERAEAMDDLTIGVDVELSKNRVGASLDEYKENAEQDIAAYDVEADPPPDVMQNDDSDEAETEDEAESEVHREPDIETGAPDDVSEHEANDAVLEEDADDAEPEDVVSGMIVDNYAGNFDENGDVRPTQNLDYMNHTTDNIRVDNDPTQIASVRTAVERDGVGARKGADIDIAGFTYASESMLVDNIISDDLSNLYVEQPDAEGSEDGNTEPHAEYSNESYSDDQHLEQASDDVPVESWDPDDAHDDDPPDTLFGGPDVSQDADIGDPDFDTVSRGEHEHDDDNNIL